MTGHVMRMRAIKNVYQILIGKPKEKRLLTRRGLRQWKILKYILQINSGELL